MREQKAGLNGRTARIVWPLYCEEHGSWIADGPKESCPRCAEEKQMPITDGMLTEVKAMRQDVRAILTWLIILGALILWRVW